MAALKGKAVEWHREFWMVDGIWPCANWRTLPIPLIAGSFRKSLAVLGVIAMRLRWLVKWTVCVFLVGGMGGGPAAAQDGGTAATASREVGLNVRKALDEARQMIFVGGREEAERAKRAIAGLEPTRLSEKDRESWVRLSREIAVRLGDREQLEKLSKELDSFDSQTMYRILTASGQLERADLEGATKTLDALGDLATINPREQRRAIAIRARVAQLRGDGVGERERLEELIDHLPYWPTEKCQSCHNVPSDPTAMTYVPVQQLWFGERYVELLRERGEAEKLKREAMEWLAKEPEEVRATLRLAFAERALGNGERWEELLRTIPWVQGSDGELKKPRMMTAFP